MRTLPRRFIDESGKPKTAGAIVANADLATTLAAVRTAGSDGFLSPGNAAARAIAYASQQGGGISVADMGAL